MRSIHGPSVWNSLLSTMLSWKHSRGGQTSLESWTMTNTIQCCCDLTKRRRVDEPTGQTTDHNEWPSVHVPGGKMTHRLPATRSSGPLSMTHCLNERLDSVSLHKTLLDVCAEFSFDSSNKQSMHLYKIHSLHASEPGGVGEHHLYDRWAVSPVSLTCRTASRLLVFGNPYFYLRQLIASNGFPRGGIK